MAPARLGLAISAAFRRTMPDPFVIAILLMLVTAVLALGFGFVSGGGETWLRSRSAAAIDLLDAWRGDAGVWKLLAFAMQMCLVLVSGHALASAPPIRRAIERLAEAPRSTRSAAALVGFTACVAGVVNWGLGLVVGAILAREVGRAFARRGAALHYPLVCAAGYTCMMVWHGGLSGSAPLSVTTLEGAAKTMPRAVAERLVGAGIPLSETLFSPLNLVITGGLLVIVPACLWLLAPSDAGERARSSPSPAPTPHRRDATADAPDPSAPTAGVPAWLERSPLLAWLLALMFLLGLWRFAGSAGLMSVGLNEINAAMIALGLVLHGSPMRWMNAVEDGARGCASIMVQFPLYAGVMAMLLASGLVARFAETMTAIDSPRGMPVVSFIAACAVNVFIPSGGGQWAVQGPIALEAGQMLGVAPGKMVMTVAYGDQMTNMLQPFWALPLLAITGVRAAEIVGYTTLVMLVGCAWTAGVLAVM